MSKTKHDREKERYYEDKESKYAKNFKLTQSKRLTDKHFKNAIKSRSLKDIIMISEEL
jgi:hypothetical protein